jgi:cysteine-rich repeat protein
VIALPRSSSFFAVIVLVVCGQLGCSSHAKQTEPKRTRDAGHGLEDGSTTKGTSDHDAAVDTGVATGQADAGDTSVCGDGKLEGSEVCDDGNRSDGDGCSARCELEAGFSCATPGAACDVCGDGAMQSAEQCDDGNHNDGDGCDTHCKLESGWTCPVAGQQCENCGDGILQTNERCDEGGFADAVGCSEDCTKVDAHYSCPAPGAACVLCGDGIVEGKEACDDGNTVSGDGCVFSCFAVEPGWVCAPSGGACSICGDGILDAALEQCDDGNFQSDDGCSSSCKAEPGAVCFQEGVLCAVCGNGYVEATGKDAQGNVTLEQCDDGNLIDGDGCSSTCQHDPAFQCPLPGVACNDCGNGIVEGIERCDDGGNVDGDGCSADCSTIGTHYNCFAGGQPCVVCGNGVLEAGEACDDGNTAGGDGCSRDCRTLESGYHCQTTNVGAFVGCAKCGDGVLELNEVCDDHNAVGGDGCSADCLSIEAGYNCMFVGYSCVQCGNGLLEPGEQCDEGSSKTAGCNAQCQVVAPWVCPVAGQPCELCGDGQRGVTESCDDGNVASSDGCSSTCEIEPGYVCTGASCLAAACGDGARAGNEQCDDGNQLSGDGCSTVCTVETGWVCGSLGCHRTVCGDTVVEGAEQCDDGNTAPLDGCDATCKLEATYQCSDPGQPCTHTVCGDGFVEGTEQCDDGNLSTGDGCNGSCRFEPNYACVPADKRCHGGTNAGMLCTSELSCGTGDCSFTDSQCHTTVCGDGVVEGTEQCDDAGKAGTCRGGAQDGASCTSDTSCTGGGACVDGCSSTCTVQTFYHCTGSPSVCKPILDFVAVRRFNVSNVDPDGLVYDPYRRSFAGHKRVASQKAIELCLDGSVINPNDTTAGPYGTISLPDGTTQAVTSSYVPPIRPTQSATLLEAAYDPFTGHDLYLTSQGGTVVLTEVALCTVQSCPPGTYFQLGVDNIANFQVVITGAGGAQGLTVGEDGDLYVTDDTAKTVYVFARRRDSNQNIIIPRCAQTPDPSNNCTSFASSPTLARSFSAPTADVLDAIFTVPGESMVGLFNKYTGAPSYTGIDAQAGTTYTSSEYFSFYQPSLGTNPPLYGRSALPGLLFGLGGIGQSYTKYAQSAETASDGGSFILCPNNPSEDCQLFARTCRSDADCAAIVPGTLCNLGAPVPYCSSQGQARDDYAKVPRNSSGNVIDVLANDSRSESSCRDPEKRVINLKGANGQNGSSVTTVDGGSVTITNGGGNVTYTAPSGTCGFVDQFDYDAALGGGVVGTATVRVLVLCVCGDGVRDPSEQCDLGAGNGPLPSRCSATCTINVVCGDGFIDPGEACDDGNTVSGDGCSARCTLESVCGDHVVEGVEECDDGNTVSGDLCNSNCVLPMCGDSNVDVQTPYLEQCDLGLNNSNTANSTCSTLCKVIAHCGNSHVELGEQCDDGNVLSGDGCSSLCTIEGKCGNGTLDSGEECDTAITTTQCGGKAACGSFCYCNNYCGDGRIGGTEQCDDGNNAAGDGCRADCTAEVCGDGILDMPPEQCDDGNNIATDKCTNNCIAIAVCGDGVVDAGEQCDDHNVVSGDGCTSTCKLETAVCGNGALETGEQCDDGNNVSNDGCSASCLLEAGTCGNGALDVGEQCDDGNTAAGDGCDASCRFEGCGDGIKVPPEECDDGNRTNRDGCSSMCTIEVL